MHITTFSTLIKGAKLTRAEQSSVLTAFLPSFLKSIADDEWQRFTFTLYLSFDEGDHLWDDSRNFANLDRHIHTMIGPHSESINVKFIRLPATHGWLTYIWNMMFARSMNDGCDYYYQLNDDLHFESAGWATMLTGKLSEHNGFGVAGPNDPVWKCKILTQAMVSR